MAQKKFGPPWTKAAVAKEAKQYRGRTEFKLGSPGAHTAAKKNGWFDEVFRHMVTQQRPRGYWTKKRVAEEAKRYKTRGEFVEKNKSAYVIAHRNGWLEDVCAHMTRERRPHGFWTEGVIVQEAQKYQSRKEFKQGSSRAYAVALDGAYLDEVCAHMQELAKPKGYWTKKRILEQAEQYGTRSAFKRGSSKAYQAAQKLRILEEVCASLPLQSRPAGYWTKKRIQEEANNYTRRPDFKKGSSAAFSAAEKSGQMDEVCAHMEKTGHRYKRAIYAIEFEDRSVYVGLTYNYDKRFAAHRRGKSHAGKKLEKVPAEFVRFDEWMSIEEAAKEEARTIERYQKAGWEVLNIAKAGAVGSARRLWTYENVKAAAAKHKTVKEFKQKEPGAYSTANKKGWMAGVGKHLKRGVEHGKWSKEALAEIAKKYKTRNQFRIKNSNAYRAAYSKGLLDEVCIHMPKRASWTYENVKAAAAKHKMVKEFKQKEPGAYQTANKKGWMADVGKHLKRGTEHGKWSKEVLVKVASKYETRSEFKNNSKNAYDAAVTKGLLEEVCTHMPKRAKRRSR
ncbi:MAG: GIY-YIG nuclease family protein [bacterium]|nr:GIY-YIG nuclease family protein [bacterium]